MAPAEAGDKLTLLNFSILKVEVVFCFKTDLHIVKTQNTVLLIVITVRTSILTLMPP
jgi:hypothetical protein